jgi:RNA polymerase sigma-70 factor, ECF subfamily
MTMSNAPVLRAQIDAIYRDEAPRVLATLIRLLGDFDTAEEAMHVAFSRAVEQWPTAGVPANPRSWLVSAARFAHIDQARRRQRFDASVHRVRESLYPADLGSSTGNRAPDAADEAEPEDSLSSAGSEQELTDDQLRLIFTCCHPALAETAQVALTLREVCRLKTEEIARAFLVTPQTIAQRIVRAKSKIRTARIPYQLPPRAELPARLDAVLHVVYLVFNEGYLASSGDSLTRTDLSEEAIRLCRLIRALIPDPEVDGLLALMLLHESRRETRATAEGDMVLLEEQDRSRWDRALIREGCALVRASLGSGRVGRYAVQAAISAVHAEAAHAPETDWQEIVGLYDVLCRLDSSPVIRLNRAVALAMRDTPEAGLREIDALLAAGHLATYHLAHAARAELLRRIGRIAEAREAYERALTCFAHAAERRFLERRLTRLTDTDTPAS